MIYNQIVTWTAFAILAMFYQLVEGRTFVRESGKTSTLEFLSEKVVRTSLSG